MSATWGKCANAIGEPRRQQRARHDRRCVNDLPRRRTRDGSWRVGRAGCADQQGESASSAFSDNDRRLSSSWHRRDGSISHPARPTLRRSSATEPATCFGLGVHCCINSADTHRAVSSTVRLCTVLKARGVRFGRLSPGNCGGVRRTAHRERSGPPSSPALHGLPITRAVPCGLDRAGRCSRDVKSARNGSEGMVSEWTGPRLNLF